MTHIHKHSNSEGANGLFNRLFPRQANWSLVKLPSTAAQMRGEKINSDARQNHHLKSMTSIQKQICRRNGETVPAWRSRALTVVVVLVRGNVRTPDLVDEPEDFWSVQLQQRQRKVQV